MKNRLALLLVAVCSVTIFSLGAIFFSSTSAAGPHRFDNGTIKGVWGFSANGTIQPPALPSATPAVAVGLVKFDGDGRCSFTDQVNIGGTAIPSTGFRTSSSCDYSVNTDGTGTITVSFPSEGPTPLTFVIVDKAEELRFIRTDAGVASGVAKKQG